MNILWDLTIQTDREINRIRPDITVHGKNNNKVLIIDTAVPGDSNVESKEKKKQEKYQDLVREIYRLWRAKLKTKVIQVIVGTLGVILKNLKGHLKEIGIPNRVRTLQMHALLGTAII